MTDEASTQHLGLSDLGSARRAGGIWHVTAALAGRRWVGREDGARRAAAAPARAWPEAKTPLEGVLELRVQQTRRLGPMAARRLAPGGELHASAAFGGRSARRSTRGRVEGYELGVRNLLQGMN